MGRGKSKFFARTPDEMRAVFGGEEVAAMLGLAGQVATLQGNLQAVDCGQEQFDVVW